MLIKYGFKYFEDMWIVDTGVSLATSDTLPDFNIGVTEHIFHMLGNVLSFRDRLKKKNNGK